MDTKTQAKFTLGQTVATPGAMEALERNHTSGKEYLCRHAIGDWGIVCDEDKHANDAALQSGARIVSAYQLADETKLWIITEAAVDDQGTRPSTCLLLPEEY